LVKRFAKLPCDPKPGASIDRQRRALADREGLAEVSAPRNDIRVTATSAHGYLPGADHLVARGQAADAAIADGDQEGLVGHRRQTQHAIGGFPAGRPQ
jgi:hypothetical protein